MPVNPNVLDPNKWVKPREKEKKQEPWLSRVTVTTDSGKQYDLDSQELNWIKNRYAQDNADSYGYDAADQAAKAAGQMSAKMLSSYGKSNVDRQLAELGLPSQKNLDKYVGQFQQWNTGGIGKVFGNSLSSQDWSSIGNLYKQSWKYTDSAEDQMRKQKGLMPSALEANYTDTEVDDQLKAGGLPSFKDFNTYLGQYNNQRGIDALYANAAASYTAMRTRQDVNTKEYVKDDNKNYTLVVDPATGRTETKTGRDWYAQAFYDELGRTDKDGNLVYGDIMPLLKPSKTGEESYIDPTKSYIEQMDNLYKDKAKEDKVEFDGHSAFSYDDFEKRYPEYYDAYIKDMPWDDNQTVDARLGVISREADAQADKDFYDITDKWFDDDKGIVEFVERYQKDYPPPTPGKNGEPDYKAYYETMFSNMLAHGVSKSIVRKAMKEVRKGFRYDSTNERYEAITDAYANVNKAENKKAREEEQAKLWDYVNYDPNDPSSVAAVSGKPVKEEESGLSVNDWEKLAKDYIKQAKDEDENDEGTIELARKSVENALAGFFDPDEGIGYTGTVDDVIKVINEIEAQNWNNPAAMRKALEDYGFSKYASYSGLAADLTQNWSDDDKIDLALSLGDTKLIENADKSGEFDKGYKDIFGNAAVTGNENVHPYTKLDSADFNYALDWAKEQIADGKIPEGKAYNILAGLGFQDELEHYIPKQWHEAHYRDVIVPKMFEESGGDVRAMWEGMTEEERAATAQKMVDELSDEQMAEIFSSPTWWKSNPTVYRTFGQAFEQQLAGMVPTFASGMIVDAAVIADAIGAGITDRPAMKDSTNKLLEAQRFAQNYGSVYDGTNGAEVSSFVTDAANEVMKMMVYGNIGGGIGSAIGGAVGGTAVGSALSKALSSTKVLKWVPGFFSTMLNSTPFMASSFAGHYAEAKQMGATNAEAAKYGAVMGISEGALEGANFDYLWGRALGANKFGEMLTKGAALFRESDVIAAARIANMAASFAGEATEEGLGYFGETLWKMNSRWGRDSTEFSASDMLKEALMGGAIGLLGSAVNVGEINRHSILVDYWANYTSLPSDIVDVATGEKVFKGGTADERAAWENGDTHIMSAGEFAENLYQLDVLNKTEDAKKAQEEHKKRVDEANKKYNAVKAIETNLRAEASALDPSDPEYASKLADLNSKIRKAAQDSHDASLVREDEITKSENAMDARIEAESRQREAINKAMRDHWAGIYLQNEAEVASRDYNAIRKNWARDRQNGATVTPESRAQVAEQRAAREAKLAEAEANETVAEAEQAAQTPEDAVTKARELAYNRVYKDQEAGKAYAEGRRGENDSKMTRVEFAENERKNFQAKTTARLRRVTLELAGLEANEGMSAKEIFAEAKKAMTPEAAQKLEIYQKLSKALGLNMVVRDVVAGTSGYVHDGKLYVTLNGKQSMLRVAAHELTHYMKDYASEQYDALRNSLVNEVGQEKFDEMLADKAQEYGLDLNDSKARMEADDEVCAELCERMLENQDALERFVQSDLDAAKTLKQRLGKTLVAIKSAIRTLNISADTKKDLIKEQETIEKWYKGLSDAIDNANKAKGKATATTSTETATVTDTTTEAPQAPPVEANPDLFMGEESARREQLRTELEELAKRGTRVNGLSYQEVSDVLDRVIMGDKSNYSKADLAQIRGMLAQLIPEVQAFVNGDENVNTDVLNERVSAALDYMLERYSEGSEDYYGLRDLIPNKIALTEAAYNELRSRDMTLREASNELRNALGGKFVSFVYKKSPDYNNAMSIDELWTRITDAYGEPDGYGNIQEDALALIDYVKDRNSTSSFDDLYGSQHEDVVNAQVGEFLDAVQSMVEGKNAEQESTVRHMADNDDYSDRPVVDLSEDARLPGIVSGLKGAQKYKAIQKYILDELAGLPIHFNDGTDAVVDKSDASHIASGAGDKKTEEIDKIKQVIENAELYATDDNAEHNKFNAFKYYESIVKFGNETFPIYLNVGRAMNDGSYHLYDITHNIRESAGRINGLERAGGLRSANGFSDTDIMPETNPIVKSSAEHSLDDDYLPLAERYDAGIATEEDMAEMQRAVDEAAEAAGVPSANYAPVIYDDDENIIPLSERFNPNETDIRNMLDDDWDALIQQYGAKPQGREPRASDIRVPNKLNDKTRVSDFGKSLMESKHMTNDMREEGKRLMLEKNWMGYEPKSDDKSMTEARNWIAARQPVQAQQEFHDMVMQGKFGSKTNAIGLQLLTEASERGDVDSFFSIATDLQMATTDAGRAVQILNMLKELKGVGSAYYMQRYVERLNNQYDDQIQSGKMQPITVAPELMDQLARAKTVDEINAAEDAVGKDIARQLPLTWKARLNNWRHLSMLGAPLTQFRNLAGNLTMMGKNAAKDIVAPAVQRVAEWAGLANEGDRTHALLTSADKSYWEPFAEQSYKEQQRHLSGTDKFGVKSSTNQHMRMFDTKWLNAIAKGANNGENQSTKKGIAGFFETIKNNGALGMLNVVDDMFIKPQYKAALKQYMKAQGYTLNAEGEAGKVNSKGEWTAMTKGEKAEAEEWATQQAWKATFHDASDLADTLNKLSNKGPVWNVFIEGVMPYKKTPINIAKRGFEYSPAGIVMGTVQLLTSVKKGKMSAAQAIDNIASGITGTALMTVGMFLAKAGLIRAGGEDKKKYETYLEDTGDQKFALKFGDYSIDLSALSPASIPLFMGVALQERIDNGDWSNLELSDIADVFAGALNPFMEMSFMSSLNSALQNYSNGGIAGAVGGTVKTIAQNYASQYLPTLGSKVAQFIDPTRRTTKSSSASPLGGSMDYYVRSLMKKVPGVASTLQPDVDVWGRTDTKDSFGEWALDFANKFILSTQVRVSNRDAVDNELIRLVENTGSTDFLPSDGNKYFKRGDKTYNMTAKQYTEYSQDRGQASYAALKEVMQSAVYKSASDDEKAAMLEKALKAAQTQVNTKWKEILGVFDD